MPAWQRALSRQRKSARLAWRPYSQSEFNHAIVELIQGSTPFVDNNKNQTSNFSTDAIVTDECIACP